MAGGWKVGSTLVAAGTVAGVMLGCSETLPLINLPDIAKLPQKVMSKDEQQKAMNQMIEKGQSSPAEAAKQIESGK
jgi:hypothetical protein